MHRNKYNYPSKIKRVSSIGSNDNSLKDYYEYKLNKYKKLLHKVNNMDYYPENYPRFNYDYPPPNYNDNYYPPPPRRNYMNGDDIYNDVYNGLQRQLYRNIFGDIDGGIRRERNGMPNQYQINNYYPPPPYMTPGMGMPPYYFMMNPYPNKKGDLFVQMGGMKAKMSIEKLAPYDEHYETKAPVYSPSKMNSFKLRKIDISNTLDLRGVRVEDGLDRLDEYLDKASLANLSPVTIIHGHGTGAMKSAVRDYLATSPYVAKFRPGGDTEGGDGVSVVDIK